LSKNELVEEINSNLMSIAEVTRDSAILTETISVSSEQLNNVPEQLGIQVIKLKLTG
jgi:methyl-accepting chemotaxis protein